MPPGSPRKATLMVGAIGRAYMADRFGIHIHPSYRHLLADIVQAAGSYKPSFSESLCKKAQDASETPHLVLMRIRRNATHRPFKMHTPKRHHATTMYYVLYVHV